MSKIWLSEKENQLTKQKLKNSACFKALLCVCLVCGIVALIDVGYPNERYDQTETFKAVTPLWKVGWLMG